MNKKELNFWNKVKKTDTCWIWTGSCFTSHNTTYGTFGKKDLAHRYSYELHYGKIPDNLVIDHICRNGLCVNPKHLEAVTNIENILRGNGACAINARKTHCLRGHLLAGSNLRKRKDNRRVCVICDRQRFKV